MAIAYRRKYPDARSKSDQYKYLVSNLRSYRSTLQGYITQIKSSNPIDYETTRLKGDYYDSYVDKKDNWFSLLDQTTKRLEYFLLQVDSCIQSADSLRNMWYNRISIMEVYDDGKEN